MNIITNSSRRKFIKAGGIVIATSMLGAATNALAKEDEKKKADVAQFTPNV
jgi:hypothetical protein